MGAFLIAISLLSPSVFGMSQDATTEPFVECFPEWAEADQVLVICNDIKIAQYCDQSCRTMNKPGVSLEKGSNDVCLTITNCSYDLCSCEATSFIDHKPQESKRITVDVCSQDVPSTFTTPAVPPEPPSPKQTEPLHNTKMPEASTGEALSTTDKVAIGVPLGFIGFIAAIGVIAVIVYKVRPEVFTSLRERFCDTNPAEPVEDPTEMRVFLPPQEIV